jgi:hypothetical protein
MDKGAFIGGAVPVRCENSTDGEFWGLVLSLRHVLALISPATPTAVVLQCDNIGALAWVRSFHPGAKEVDRKHGTHEVRSPPKLYPSTMEPAILGLRSVDPALKIWLKHVKGHSKAKDARSWVNKQCDRQAREFMSAQRARFGG